ncbi:MAG: AAA family ATPase [Propioniciclava sp.]
MASLLVQRRRPVLVSGAPGSGKTALLGALAAQLQARGDSRVVKVVGPRQLSWRPEGQWLKVISGMDEPTILCLDDFDELARLGSGAPNMELLVQVADTRNHPDVHLVLLCTPDSVLRLQTLFEEFAADLVRVDLQPLAGAELETALAPSAEALSVAHSVSFSGLAVKAAATPPRSSDRRVHPGLALDRLDAAAALARLAGETDVSADRVETSALDDGPWSTGRLTEALARRVRGQDEAIAVLADRLALTTARLDLRPERPDGVLLFVGPTGVGKTELARTLAEVLGGSGALIRLDMSEYAHDWAVSRITGPAPGYVGSTDPRGWLTTRVNEHQRCVVLLDEIEKAHPTVWNTFLQAFDSGRLTDGAGVTADLSRVVFIMTSNLGVEQASKAAVGFGTSGDEVAQHHGMAARIMAVVKDRMPPELINRMDDVVVFNRLSLPDITDIAHLELERVQQRFADHGRVVELSPDVASYLAATGYDPAYGARHLHRNIERLLLTAMARSDATAISVGVVDDQIVVR